MQQRQLRLGDILDDYCTRERRLTNHAVVAMVGDDVKQTRCTTCDTEHEYKHAKVPRQRRKSDSPAALYAQVVAGAPKVVTPPQAAASVRADEHSDDLEVEDGSPPVEDGKLEHDEHADDPEVLTDLAPGDDRVTGDEGATGDGVEADETDEGGEDDRKDDEGPVHRPLIRASLPREGQPPPARPIPEFTIRQPGGRPNRFRPRHPGGGGPPFRGDRSTGNGFGGPGGPGGQHRAGPRHGGGRPPQGAVPSRLARRHGPGGRKRQK
jgi:hypothetical protein